MSTTVVLGTIEFTDWGNGKRWAKLNSIDAVAGFSGEDAGKLAEVYAETKIDNGESDAYVIVEDFDGEIDYSYLDLKSDRDIVNAIEVFHADDNAAGGAAFDLLNEIENTLRGREID